MTNRNTYMAELPRGGTVECWELTNEEEELFDQVMWNGHGGDPQLRKLFEDHYEDLKTYLGYVMAQERQPFTGLRHAGSEIGACILHPQHLAPVADAATNINMGGWKFDVNTAVSGSAKSWYYRTQAGATTEILKDQTAQTNIWVCIIGVSTDSDQAAAAKAIDGANTDATTGIQFTVDGYTWQPIPLYTAAMHSATNDIPMVSIPTIFIPEESVFTEKAYGVEDCSANAWNERLIGVTFGVSSKLATL